MKIIKDAPWKKHAKRKTTDPLIMTEYETVTTLETICNSIKGYNLKDGDWVRVSEAGKMPVSFSFGGENPDLNSINFEKSIGEQRSVREYDDKIISSYCLKLMEDRDEVMSDLILSKTLTTENVRFNTMQAMCRWENTKKSPCKTDDELRGHAPANKAGELEGEGAKVVEEDSEKKEEEPEKKEEKSEKKEEKETKKTKKAKKSKKSKKEEL